jgi:tRNA(Ile)-lysidine synthase
MPLAQPFAAAMARLGPFGTPPRLAVAVSGGADSSALALLAQSWAAGQNGSILALIVDHGLRESSAAEASLTASRLQVRGIKSRILALRGLSGPAIQEKARAARYDALLAAAEAEKRVHLLLGHHEADQSETLTMRAARGPGGAEGIAAWSARSQAVLLRPLLGIPPAELRAYLLKHGMPWVEDPSNANPAFERVRIRQSGAPTRSAETRSRQVRDREAASFLACFASIHPEGFARLNAAMVPPAALSALIRTLGGNIYPPPQQAIARLAAALRPATLGGVRIVPAGRLGPGFLLAREPAACAAPVPAIAGALWDCRFTLASSAAAHSFGALGADAPKFKHYNNLPALVLRGMPCLRGPEGQVVFPIPDVLFTPPAPATSHPFLG